MAWFLPGTHVLPLLGAHSSSGHDSGGGVGSTAAFSPTLWSRGSLTSPFISGRSVSYLPPLLKALLTGALSPGASTSAGTLSCGASSGPAPLSRHPGTCIPPAWYLDAVLHRLSGPLRAPSPVFPSGSPPEDTLPAALTTAQRVRVAGPILLDCLAGPDPVPLLSPRVYWPGLTRKRTLRLGNSMSRASLPWWVRRMQSAFSAPLMPSITIYFGLPRRPDRGSLPLGSAPFPTHVQSSPFLLPPGRHQSAHASIPASSCSALQIHAHDVNEVAACILMRTNSSIPSILRAARWRTPSVFIKHYLWEIVWREDFAPPLTPVVVAGYVGA